MSTPTAASQSTIDPRHPSSTLVADASSAVTDSTSTAHSTTIPTEEEQIAQFKLTADEPTVNLGGGIWRRDLFNQHRYHRALPAGAGMVLTQGNQYHLFIRHLLFETPTSLITRVFSFDDLEALNQTAESFTWPIQHWAGLAWYETAAGRWQAMVTERDQVQLNQFADGQWRFQRSILRPDGAELCFKYEQTEAAIQALGLSIEAWITQGLHWQFECQPRPQIHSQLTEVQIAGESLANFTEQQHLQSS